MLLAFVDERGDNGALLRLLAACRAEIDAACWGVFLLQPHERAGCRLPDSVLPGARTNASPSPNPSPSPQPKPHPATQILGVRYAAAMRLRPDDRANGGFQGLAASDYAPLWDCLRAKTTSAAWLVPLGVPRPP